MAKPFCEKTRGPRCFAELFWCALHDTIYGLVKYYSDVGAWWCFFLSWMWFGSVFIPRRPQGRRRATRRTGSPCWWIAEKPAAFAARLVGVPAGSARHWTALGA